MSYKIDYPPQTLTKSKLNGQPAFKFNQEIGGSADASARPDQYLVSKDQDGQWNLVGDSVEIGTKTEGKDARQNFGLWTDKARDAGGILFWKHDARQKDNQIQPDEVLSLGKWQNSQRFTSYRSADGPMDMLRKNKLTSVELSASGANKILLDGEWRAKDFSRYGLGE